MHRSSRIAVVVLCSILLSACATGFNVVHKECVPYARDVSGIEIYGNAHTWWDKAPKESYARGRLPKRGSVLVLSRTSRLQYGHVAVVENVLNSREITVTHTNWGKDFMSRRKVYSDMLARDVSPKNDWSQVQFWVPESEKFGRSYSAKGFIYNAQPQYARLKY